MRATLLLIFVWLTGHYIKACQCPPTQLSREECEKYDIIFRGKVKAVKTCGSTPGIATFEITELYKGNVQAEFPVIFKCEGECALGFHEGEEWIIYTRYKQINNAQMDWCSRSRKYFNNEKEDFYLVNYGNDFFTELEFLRKDLGIHRPVTAKAVNEPRNYRPTPVQSIWIVLASIASIVLFYILFRKFFR